jgi:hypothetical protein
MRGGIRSFLSVEPDDMQDNVHGQGIMVKIIQTATDDTLVYSDELSGTYLGT